MEVGASNSFHPLAMLWPPRAAFSWGVRFRSRAGPAVTLLENPLFEQHLLTNIESRQLKWLNCSDLWILYSVLFSIIYIHSFLYSLITLLSTTHLLLLKRGDPCPRSVLPFPQTQRETNWWWNLAVCWPLDFNYETKIQSSKPSFIQRHLFVYLFIIFLPPLEYEHSLCPHCLEEWACWVFDKHSLKKWTRALRCSGCDSEPHTLTLHRLLTASDGSAICF